MSSAQRKARQAFCDELAGEQPWRCIKCSTAVRIGYNDPCKCLNQKENCYGKENNSKEASKEI